MESNPSILNNEIPLEPSQISEIKLTDGTILKVSPNFGQLNKKKFLHPGKKTQNENVQQKCKENHNHHRDGIGAFGQHFKTEYSQVCPDCTQGSGIIKQRQNYMLYVSKNVTEEDISKKHKNKTVVEVPEQVPVKPKPINQNYTKVSYNQQQSGKVISQGYAECDYVPIPKPKPKLRNQINKYQTNLNICPECSEGEKVQNVNQLQNQVGDNLCPDCYNEEQEEKITTTVKVLVPDENAL